MVLGSFRSDRSRSVGTVITFAGIGSRSQSSSSDSVLDWPNLKESALPISKEFQSHEED